jgi:hypothetical protein
MRAVPETPHLCWFMCLTFCLHLAIGWCNGLAGWVRRPVVQSTRVGVSFPSITEDLDPACREHLVRFTLGCVFEDVMEYIDHYIDPDADYLEKWVRVISSPVRMMAHCTRHGCQCRLPAADLDSSSFPCTDFSMSGSVASFQSVSDLAEWPMPEWTGAAKNVTIHMGKLGRKHIGEGWPDWLWQGLVLPPCLSDILLCFYSCLRELTLRIHF